MGTTKTVGFCKFFIFAKIYKRVVLGYSLFYIKIYNFIADTPESDGKWNIKLINLSDIDNKKGLLISSKQDYNPIKSNTLDNLRNELAGTESYIILREDFSGEKRVIQIGETIDPSEISLKYDKTNTSNSLQIQDESEVKLVLNLLDLFKDITKSDISIIDGYMQENNLSPFSTKEDIEKVFLEMIGNENISENIRENIKKQLY